MSQLYLFIIWDESRFKSESIINDIKTKFVIRDIYDIQWNKENFLNNLIRFYGHSLPDAKKKSLLCGTGSFLLIIVEDATPIFRIEKGLYSDLKINENIANAKMKYRDWVGKEFSIHGSIYEKETNHDLTLLLGKTSDQLLENLPPKWNGEIKKFQSDLFGFGGFKNMNEFLHLLNGTINYVILRNFENLPQNVNSKNHNDIDLLTDDLLILPYVLMTNGDVSPKGNIPSNIKIGNDKISIDWKRPGDGYYDHKWASDILKRRIYNPNGFFVPSLEDYFYSLFYHAIFHKKRISTEYKEKLLKISSKLGITISPSLFDDFNSSKIFIEKYMKEMKYMRTDTFWYILKNNEFLRLIKTAKFLFNTQGSLFLINEICGKIKRTLKNKS